MSVELWKRSSLDWWKLDDAAPASAGPMTPFAPETARRIAEAGAELTTLEEAAKSRPALLAPCAAADFRRLEAANLAAWKGGAFLRVPRGVRLEEPVVLSFRHAGPGRLFPRAVVVLEEGSETTVVEEHVSDGAANQVSAAFSQVSAAEGARARVCYLQELPGDAVHFWHQRVELARGARLEHVSALLGGGRHKSALDVQLAGPEARSEIRSLALGRGGRRFDVFTAQHHRAPRTFSDLLHRSALRGQVRSSFTGLIRVEGCAVDSDAFQSNHNLMLSESARADSTPVLEILTDAVRCKHGATAGPLDPEQLYYLACRGVPEAEASRELVRAFLDPVLGRLPQELAQRLAPRIEEALSEVDDAA